MSYVFKCKEEIYNPEDICCTSRLFDDSIGSNSGNDQLMKTSNFIHVKSSTLSSNLNLHIKQESEETVFNICQIVPKVEPVKWDESSKPSTSLTASAAFCDDGNDTSPDLNSAIGNHFVKTEMDMNYNDNCEINFGSVTTNEKDYSPSQSVKPILSTNKLFGEQCGSVIVPLHASGMCQLQKNVQKIQIPDSRNLFFVVPSSSKSSDEFNIQSTKQLISLKSNVIVLELPNASFNSLHPVVKHITEEIKCISNNTENDVETSRQENLAFKEIEVTSNYSKKMPTVAPPTSFKRSSKFKNVEITSRCPHSNGKKKTYNVQCRLCNKWYVNDSFVKRKHVYTHLETESDIKWLFKCLLCSHTSMDPSNGHLHVINSHRIEPVKLTNGIHYEEQLELYNEEIDRIQRAAFPELFVYDILSTNKLSNEEIIPRNMISKNRSLAIKNPACLKKLSKNVKGTSPRCRNFNKTKTVQCRLCKKACNNRTSDKRQHAITHLKTESKVKWFFKCLLCSYKSMGPSFGRSHIANMHRIMPESLQSGVHYLEQLEMYNAEVERIQNAAFPEDIQQVDQNSKAKIPHRVQCRLCKNSYKNETSTKRAHALTHLKTESKIEWFFKCMLCSYKATGPSCIRTHVINVHNVKTDSVTLDVHYKKRLSLFNAEIKRIQKAAFPEASSKIASGKN